MPSEKKQSKCRARLFTNGRSQAVRLPKSLRFETDEVLIWREGDRIILEAVPRTNWPDGYWEKLDALEPLLETDIEPLRAAFLDLDSVSVE